MKKPLMNPQLSQHAMGHVISGAVASAIVAGTMNYRKMKNGDIKKPKAIKDTVKVASQGAVATGAAIVTADYLRQKGGLFKAATAASIGIMGIYALEVIDDKLTEKMEEKMQGEEE